MTRRQHYFWDILFLFLGFMGQRPGPTIRSLHYWIPLKWDHCPPGIIIIIFSHRKHLLSAYLPWNPKAGLQYPVVRFNKVYGDQRSIHSRYLTLERKKWEFLEPWNPVWKGPQRPFAFTIQWQLAIPTTNPHTKCWSLYAWILPSDGQNILSWVAHLWVPETLSLPYGWMQRHT